MKIQITGKELQQAMSTAAAIGGKIAATLPMAKAKNFRFSMADMVVKAENDGVIAFTPESDGGVSIEINPAVMVKTMQLMTPAYLAMVDVLRETINASKVFDGVAKEITAYEDQVRADFTTANMSLEEVEKRTKEAEIAAKVNTISDPTTWTPEFRTQVLYRAQQIQDAETARTRA